MLPEVDALHNESDVEQKLVFPLLNAPIPEGLGFPISSIKTKTNIRRYSIGKGKEQKLYFPDYLIVLSGLPLLVVEVKGPEENLIDGYREARLYAYELNAAFQTGLNPVSHVIATNGKRLWAGPVDSATPKFDLALEELDSSSLPFASLQAEISITPLERNATNLAQSLVRRPFKKPTRLVGGQSVRNEEIGHNSFGATIALDYRHLFNPATREERALVAREAYIPSKRRERYIEPIDQIIRAAKPPSETDATLIEDTGKPDALIKKLKDPKPLEHQVLLLIGSVGSGKSTFIDYLSEVALPEDLLRNTLWVHINMNTAPVSHDAIYEWLSEQIMEGCRSAYSEVDFDLLENQRKLYSVELRKFDKGVGKLFSQDDPEYRRRLADEIVRLHGNTLASAKAYSRHCAAERGKLLIVALDNCDKRTRDEQLLMFQAAVWLQREFRALILLPLRDETYDNHRNEPPLDTALKDLVFRIEAPMFQHVLTKRVQLALRDMKTGAKTTKLSYVLPNGIRVEYPLDDQAFYLTAILRSLYEHDFYLRRMIIGLSGRDIRRAMELFLEICHSGHITEDIIFKIRQSRGEYILPLELVARVLLRMNRRFYDGEIAYLRNVFALEPSDPYPTYFTRLLILRWLQAHFREIGPAGIQGYWRVATLKSDIAPYGLSEQVLDREILFLLKAQCIIAEHLRVDTISNDDLIKLAPAGFIHLESVEMVDYLAAVAEDTWYIDDTRANEIAHRIVSVSHYEVTPALRNARDVIDYLHEQKSKSFPSPEAFLERSDISQLLDLTGSVKALEKAEAPHKRNPWFLVDKSYHVGRTYKGRISNRVDYGVFVELQPGIIGLAHRSKVPSDFLTNDDYMPGEEVDVTILKILSERRRIELLVKKSD
jgi:energy-coupling factor transporter ATP-binding protein EcfA2